MTRSELKALAMAGVTVLFAAGCATPDGGERVDARAKAVLDTLELTGEVSRCVPLTRLGQIRPVTENAFLVETGVRNWQLLRTSGRCQGATRQQNRIEYTTALTQLCTGDILRIVDNQNGFFVGGCSVQEFERLAPKAEEPAAE